MHCLSGRTGGNWQPSFYPLPWRRIPAPRLPRPPGRRWKLHRMPIKAHTTPGCDSGWSCRSLHHNYIDFWGSLYRNTSPCQQEILLLPQKTAHRPPPHRRDQESSRSARLSDSVSYLLPWKWQAPGCQGRSKTAHRSHFFLHPYRFLHRRGRRIPGPWALWRPLPSPRPHPCSFFPAGVLLSRKASPPAPR